MSSWVIGFVTGSEFESAMNFVSVKEKLLNLVSQFHLYSVIDLEYAFGWCSETDLENLWEIDWGSV